MTRAFQDGFLSGFWVGGILVGLVLASAAWKGGPW